MLGKICVILAAFGAVNWTVLAFFETDAIKAVLGSSRTIGTDAVHIVVAFAAIGAFVSVFRKAPD